MFASLPSLRESHLIDVAVIFEAGSAERLIHVGLRNKSPFFAYIKQARVSPLSVFLGSMLDRERLFVARIERHKPAVGLFGDAISCIFVNDLSRIDIEAIYSVTESETIVIGADDYVESLLIGSREGKSTFVALVMRVEAFTMLYGIILGNTTSARIAYESKIGREREILRFETYTNSIGHAISEEVELSVVIGILADRDFDFAIR